MKVMHLISGGDSGGAKTHVHTLLQSLSRTPGVEVTMVTFMEGPFTDEAKALGIPHDVEVMEGHTGTNGWHMQIVREGVPTSVVSLPLKYMHSPIEVLDLADIESTAALLAAFAENLGKEAKELC